MKVDFEDKCNNLIKPVDLLAKSTSASLYNFVVLCLIKYCTCKGVLTHFFTEFYQTRSIRLGINANARIRPIELGINSNALIRPGINLITCTCIVNVKLNKYSCSRLLLDNGTSPYSNTFIFNVSE